MPEPEIDDRWILSLRGGKNKVDTLRPYAFLTEPEFSASGKIEETGTIFITNKECPFLCLMCDLWKNTLDQKVDTGAIPEQIRYALEKMPDVRNIKIYNSGNFFDRQAVPEDDYKNIAGLLNGYQTVIVESHPRLINESCLMFRDQLNAELQVAIGLETVHPEVLPKLNKRMTTEDFANAVQFLNNYGIRTRAFILLRPPFMDEVQGVIWAKKSIDFAFAAGVECCVIIPTRSGNGATDWLKHNGFFHEPAIQSLEEATGYGISLKKGRVFADLWNIDRFVQCADCASERKSRLIRMNLNQEVPSEIICSCQQ